MNKKDIKKIEKVAEKLGWSLTIEDKEFTFSRFSPAGQDFNMEITAESIKELSVNITNRYEGYDCSQETYLWLDNTGHGRNGAPYNIMDLYKDMEACEQMLKELSEEIAMLID